MEIIVTKPGDITKEELVKVHDLVLSGGQVSRVGLMERIIECRYLGLCYLDDKLIAVSAIKQPSESKTKRILEKAKIKNTIVPKLELGYCVTKNEFGKQGINKNINDQLLDKLENGEKIYSTTNNDTIRKYLSSNGFLKVGESYEGKKNILLDYFERSDIQK